MLENIGFEKESYQHCDPLEHVIMHQSTNDNYPTALKIAIYRLLLQLEKKIIYLQEKMQEMEKAFSAVLKLSRTELMDAVPMTMGRTFGAWSDDLSRNR